ncbi:MAG: hypothetical protein AVDCRST_MAG40-995, partial [uncultured Gemmatimonadaceae bacterium]
ATARAAPRRRDAREHVDVVAGSLVGEHYGGVALHRRQLRTLHRRAAERRAL